jgi:hypothetical protein
MLIGRTPHDLAPASGLEAVRDLDELEQGSS